MSEKGEIYADNYIKPRVIPILLVVLLLVFLFWMLLANLFEPQLGRSGFCVLLVTLLFFVSELLHRLWPVRTYCDSKDGTKITNFYLGWWGEVERTEFTDGQPSIYTTFGGRTYVDPREMVKSPRFKKQMEELELSLFNCGTSQD